MSDFKTRRESKVKNRSQSSTHSLTSSLKNIPRASLIEDEEEEGEFLPLESTVLKTTDLRNALKLGGEKDDDDWTKMIESLMSPKLEDGSDPGASLWDSPIDHKSQETSSDTGRKKSIFPDSTKPIPAHNKNQSNFRDDNSLLESATPRDSEVLPYNTVTSTKPSIPSVKVIIPSEPDQSSQIISETPQGKTEVQLSTPFTSLATTPISPLKNTPKSEAAMVIALFEAKEALKNEKVKRVTADMLLMKLYKELQKLKLVTQTSRQVKRLEELQSDIAILEQKKLALGKSVNTPHISSFDNITAKIDSLVNDESLKPELHALVSALKNEVSSQMRSVSLMKADLDFLEKAREQKSFELKQLREELETTRETLFDIKENKIDQLAEETINTIDPKNRELLQQPASENTPVIPDPTIDPPPLEPKNTAKRVPSVAALKGWTKDLKTGIAKVTGSLQQFSKVAEEVESSKQSHIERPYHKFLPHAYRSPKKCDMCDESMWGKELKCEVCGFHSHQACSNNAGICGKKTKSGDPVVFGIELSAVVEPTTNIPYFVTICVQVVEIKGMEMEGVYRKSGPGTRINALIALFNTRRLPTLEEVMANFEVTAVTSALKQFFRELPGSLIDTQHHTPLFNAIRKQATADRIAEIAQIIKSLALPNYQTLSFLIKHLHRVQLLSEKNLMVSNNLGVVFGPTLIKSDDVASDITDSPLKAAIIETMIDNAEQLFQ